MSEHDSTENRNIGNSPIKAMFSELAQLDDALRDPSISIDSDGYEDAIERHWTLREQIGATPARSLAELSLKAHALQVEAERDTSFENDGAGSARQLARSLANDVLRLAGHMQ